MGRGGKLVIRRSEKTRVPAKEKRGSDDSDEDYVLGQEEEDEGNADDTSSDYASSSSGEDSEENFDFDFEEEEEEVFRLKSRSVQKKTNVKRSRKRTRISEDDDEVDYGYKDDDGRGRRRMMAVRSNQDKVPRKRTKSSVDEYDDDVDPDEDFIPDGIDIVDDDGWGRRRRRAVRSNQDKGSRKRIKSSVDYEDDVDDEDFIPDGIDMVDDDGWGRRRRRAVRSNQDKGSRKRIKSSVDYEDDVDDEDFIPDGIDIVDDDGWGRRRRAVRSNQDKGSRKRIKSSVDYEDDVDDDKDHDDEDFIPDGIDIVDDDGWGRRRRRAVRSNQDKGSRKRIKSSVNYEDDVDDDKDHHDEDFIPDRIDIVDDDDDFQVRKKKRNTRKRLVPKRDDDNGDDDNDHDDEDFIPDGIDIVDDDDEEEDFQVRKKKSNTRRKRLVPKRVSLKVQKRKRKRRSKAANKPLRKKGKRTKRKKSVLRRRRPVCSDDDFIADNRIVKEKTNKKSGRRKKRSVFYSDSDDVESYGSSDYEYTISEEEREVLKEASIFCGNLTTCLRSSSFSKRLHVVDGTSNHHQQKKSSPGRKGKEKIEGKQVCGICFSEEGMGAVRGTLNCCNHYFCFACILEWSKVESRCPLCKQRFATISKPARSGLGIDLRSVVIRVAKRDQVYRPTEEEVRGYFDPYESVVCIECQQGGDDNLMLLCDICDSPAHTYCVGLGQEVPEGNWYCEGCRAADPGSSNSLLQDHVLNQMNVTSNLSTGVSNGEIKVESSDGTCQNSVSIQVPSVSPGIGVVPSPKHALGGGGSQATSPVTGAGASTLWGRRRIRHRIHSLLSSNRVNEGAEMASRNNGALQVNLGSEFGNSELELGGETETKHQNALLSESARSCFPVVGGLAEDSTPCPVQEEDALDASFRHWSRQINEGPSTATLSDSTGGALCADRAELNAVSGLWQLHQCSRELINGTDASVSRNTYPDDAHFHTEKAAEDQKAAKQQLQPIVRHHLKRLSQHRELDPGTFKDIARHSTHTILAACGLDHNRSIAIPVQPPSRCLHVERQSEPINQMENCCSSCFNSFASDVVRRVMNMRLQSLAFNR